MVSCYDGAEEGRYNDPRVDGVTDQSKDDLERRTIEAVRLHRELLRNAEYHHHRWRNAAETNPDREELGDLREAYRKALFEAQAQQMALSMLVDHLGRIPRLPEDEDPIGGEGGRTGR
jgi:hypothetical protein